MTDEELEKLRLELEKAQAGRSPTFEQLMSRHRRLEAAIDALEKRVGELYPHRVPRCVYCGSKFCRGGYMQCCGGG